MSSGQRKKAISREEKSCRAVATKLIEHEFPARRSKTSGRARRDAEEKGQKGGARRRREKGGAELRTHRSVWPAKEWEKLRDSRATGLSLSSREKR